MEDIKDFSLHSGERQTATEYWANRRDHINRYEMALRMLASGFTAASQTFGLDVFCGTGYGAGRLSRETGCVILGIDGSEQAIEFGRTHYATPGTLFACRVFPFKLPALTFDFALCFESLEHVADDDAFLAQLVGSVKPGGLFFLSVPNDDLQPLEPNREAYRFHHRHYRHEPFLRHLSETFPGLTLKEWFGQDVYRFQPDGIRLELLEESQMGLQAGKEGQILIYALEKKR